MRTQLILQRLFVMSMLEWLARAPAWLARRRKKVNIKETDCVFSAYWHLVDLLWIVLFPLLYLLPG